MTRTLVTGASGFIGRAVVASFAKDGRAVRAAVRTPPQPPFAADVEVVQCADFSQARDFRPLLADVDQVVHLAAIAHTGAGIDPEIYDRVNRQATAELPPPPLPPASGISCSSPRSGRKAGRLPTMP